MSHRCPLCIVLLSGQSNIPHEFETGKRWANEHEESSWPEHYQEPRICSGCGGVHPEDVFRMIKDGWTDEICDGHHKGYLHPPGWQVEVRAWGKSKERRAAKGKDIFENYPHNPIKGPPIKFYIAHFEDEQVAKLNELRKKE